MEYTYLGRTGLKISRLCLGTMNFGPRTEEKDAFRILDMALDAGINYIDTANIYGSLHGTHENNHTGWTEEILGRCLLYTSPSPRDRSPPRMPPSA